MAWLYYPGRSTPCVDNSFRKSVPPGCSAQIHLAFAERNRLAVGDDQVVIFNTGQAKTQGPCPGFNRLPPSIQIAVEGKGSEALAVGQGYPAAVRYDATAACGELASRVLQRIELSCRAGRFVSFKVDNFHSGHGIDTRGDSIGSLLDLSPKNCL